MKIALLGWRFSCALVVTVVLIFKNWGTPPSLVGATSHALSQPRPILWLEAVPPGTAWMPGSLSLGQALLL